MDEELWKTENYAEFLNARKHLLAQETNRLLNDLLHGDTHWLHSTSAITAPALSTFARPATPEADEIEEEALEDINQWMASLNLPRGDIDFELADAVTGTPIAVFDLAWPKGIQEELSQPVALLLKQNSETMARANGAGYRYFTTANDLKHYIESDILALETAK